MHGGLRGPCQMEVPESLESLRGGWGRSDAPLPHLTQRRRPEKRVNTKRNMLMKSR